MRNAVLIEKQRREQYQRMVPLALIEIVTIGVVFGRFLSVSSGFFVFFFLCVCVVC